MLGLSAETVYEEITVQLSGSEHLVLSTDGLLEARSQSGELYGFAQLATLFAGKPSAAQAIEAAVAFGQDDDITVLTLTRAAPVLISA
jgi:serine phosphatase RsbU (regulator of sigma subunit)